MTDKTAKPGPCSTCAAVPMLHPETAVQLHDEAVDRAMERFTQAVITAGFVIPALALAARWLG